MGVARGRGQGAGAQAAGHCPLLPSPPSSCWQVCYKDGQSGPGGQAPLLPPARNTHTARPNGGQLLWGGQGHALSKH